MQKVDKSSRVLLLEMNSVACMTLSASPAAVAASSQAVDTAIFIHKTTKYQLRNVIPTLEISTQKCLVDSVIAFLHCGDVLQL